MVCKSMIQVALVGVIIRNLLHRNSVVLVIGKDGVTINNCYL